MKKDVLYKATPLHYAAFYCMDGMNECFATVKFLMLIQSNIKILDARKKRPIDCIQMKLSVTEDLHRYFVHRERYEVEFKDKFNEHNLESELREIDDDSEYNKYLFQRYYERYLHDY